MIYIIITTVILFTISYIVGSLPTKFLKDGKTEYKKMGFYIWRPLGLQIHFLKPKNTFVLLAFDKSEFDVMDITICNIIIPITKPKIKK